MKKNTPNNVQNTPNSIIVKPVNHLGRLSRIEAIKELYATRKNLDINSIDMDDYIYATSVLRITMMKGNTKERVDSAKLVYNRRPETKYNVNLLVNTSWEQIKGLLEKVSHVPIESQKTIEYNKLHEIE